MIAKSQLRFEDGHATEYDFSDWPQIGQLANGDAIIEKVRYAALVSSLRETRILARNAASPLEIRLRLLTIVNSAIANWLETRNAAPASARNTDIEGEYSDHAFIVWVTGLDSPDRLQVEIFERLA